LEEFSAEVTAKVEKLVEDVDAVRNRTDLDDAQKAAKIKEIEQEIHTVRGGRVAHHRGEGLVQVRPKR